MEWLHIVCAVIGKLMVESGAADQIAHTLIDKLAMRWVKISLVVCGTVFGLAMFYEVAFIVLAPLGDGREPLAERRHLVPRRW